LLVVSKRMIISHSGLLKKRLKFQKEGRKRKCDVRRKRAMIVM